MNKTYLILAPHTDDGEFWAGGSIARWIEEGNNVYYVAFCAPPDEKEGKSITVLQAC